MIEKLEVRTYVIIGLVILAAIFLLQNLKTIEFKIIFITISMPGIIFFSILLGIGFLLGFLTKKKN